MRRSITKISTIFRWLKRSGAKITKETTGLDGKTFTARWSWLIKAAKRSWLAKYHPDRGWNQAACRLWWRDQICQYHQHRRDDAYQQQYRLFHRQYQFPGDVTIDGDVSSGFSVKAGGDLIIKGGLKTLKSRRALETSLRWAHLRRPALVMSSSAKICVANYIENAVLHVEGDITVDYIIDGKMLQRQYSSVRASVNRLPGGEIKLRGELVARDIGNDREYPTIIRILGEKIIRSTMKLTGWH